MSAPAIFAAMLDSANRHERLDNRAANRAHLDAFVQGWLRKNHPLSGGKGAT